MASSFTWLDYSEKERQKMLEILKIFEKHETRDELGIGVIRDAFSDMFFPGTSTLQTRARYFLFVPWMYLGLEEKGVPSSKIERLARGEEVKLIEALLYPNDVDGVIGKVAKKNLKRLPSSVYWQGLEAWGIRLCPYSVSDYHRSLDAFYRAGRNSSHSYEEEIDGCKRRRNWHPGLPPAPDDFPAKASFNLTGEEACYLKERVLTRWPNTMLAYLLDSELPTETVDFLWDHPICSDLPEPINEKILHARNFSEVIHGAALLYNLMLTEKARDAGILTNGDLVRGYEKKLENWAHGLQQHRDDLDRWDYRVRFWEIIPEQGARPTLYTQEFIKEWIKIVLSPNDAVRIVENESARRLISEREKRLKKNLARLENSEALAQWSRDASTKMAGRLSYRWQTAEKIVSDILNGLRGS